jgi:hypothetical protein
MSTYNFSELFKSTFKLNLGYATNSIIDGQTNKLDAQALQPIEELSPLQLKSQTGMPIWDYVKLLPKIIEGTGEQFEGYSFPFEIVVEASMPKKIVVSEVIGRDGDVEELMGNGDWQISIKGFIINYDSNDYPEAAVRELTRVCRLKETLFDVEGTYLNILGIKYLSIQKFTPIAPVGYKNMQAFEIEARSKEPFIVDAAYGVPL